MSPLWNLKTSGGITLPINVPKGAVGNQVHKRLMLSYNVSNFKTEIWGPFGVTTLQLCGVHFRVTLDGLVSPDLTLPFQIRTQQAHIWACFALWCWAVTIRDIRMNCDREYYLQSRCGQQFSRVTYVKIGNSRIMQINLLLHSPYTLC